METVKKTWLGGLFSFILLFVAMGGVSWAADCKATYGDSEIIFKLATGSPGELGMLEELADAFKAGSGKSLNLLKEQQVDVVMVHAPAAEKQAVADGWAIKRTLIGSNEFYIVGPRNDPAGIAEAATAADAYARIAQAKSPFLSRGDNSGTHKKEMAIWQQAGIEPGSDWYMITKDFMMATLKKADEVSGYFMTDSSTWVAGKKDLTNLEVLFRGDPFLINTYHALCQPEGRGKHPAIASEFIDFVGSEQGQRIIRDYGKDLYGEAMYNDAEYASQYAH
jgi:tungstate transport system substrate-binding protein